MHQTSDYFLYTVFDRVTAKIQSRDKGFFHKHD